MQRSDSQALKNLQTIRNPIQIARESAGYTQELLAAVAEVSRVLIMHTEQGLVARVPKRINKVLDDGGLDQKYQWWITDTRVKNYKYLEEYIKYFLDAECFGYGNWLALRRAISYSKAGFNKLYCIHPQILHNFEQGIESRDSFTPGIRRVLLDSGMGLEVLNSMEFAMSRRIIHA